MTVGDYISSRLILLKQTENSQTWITPEGLDALSKMNPETLRVLEQIEQDVHDTVFCSLTTDSKIPYTEESTCTKQPVK